MSRPTIARASARTTKLSLVTELVSSTKALTSFLAATRAIPTKCAQATTALTAAQLPITRLRTVTNDDALLAELCREARSLPFDLALMGARLVQTSQSAAIWTEHRLCVNHDRRSGQPHDEQRLVPHRSRDAAQERVVSDSTDSCTSSITSYEPT